MIKTLSYTEVCSNQSEEQEECQCTV